MAKTPNPTNDESEAQGLGSGKGRPTPKRSEQEAARRRPLVANTKEAKAQRRDELRNARARAQEGMANGEERFLPPRDKGPQRRAVRDMVDSSWHIGELVMPLMIVVIVLTLVQNPVVSLWAFVGLWVFILFVIGSMVILGMRAKKLVDEKFGRERREKGLAWYAAMRSMQMRFMRLPKPQVKRGGAPIER